VIRLLALIIVIAAMLGSAWFVFQSDQGLGVLILAIGVLIITPAFYKIMEGDRQPVEQAKDDNE
jgi:hypothetical protein